MVVPIYLWPLYDNTRDNLQQTKPQTDKLYCLGKRCLQKKKQGKAPRKAKLEKYQSNNKYR